MTPRVVRLVRVGIWIKFLSYSCFLRIIGPQIFVDEDGHSLRAAALFPNVSLVLMNILRMAITVAEASKVKRWSHPPQDYLEDEWLDILLLRKAF